MAGWDIALIGTVLIAYAAVSKRLAGSPITSAIVFAGIGILVGNEVFGLVEIDVGSAELRLLAEVTLALVLFSAVAVSTCGCIFARPASIPWIWRWRWPSWHGCRCARSVTVV